MSIERKPVIPIQVQVNEALNRYISLLNYYRISQGVQDIVLAKIQEKPPTAMIEEINRYWEETFGNDHREEPTSKPLEIILYESRRDRWRRFREKKNGKR